RLDQLRMRESREPGRATEDLFGPQVAVKVDLYEGHFPGTLVEPVLEPAVIEWTVLGVELARVLGDERGDSRILEIIQSIFGTAIDQVTLFVIGPQVVRISLPKNHLGEYHWVADGDDGNFDVTSLEERLNDRIMTLSLDFRDRVADTGPIRCVSDAPAGGRCIGLDHPAFGRRTEFLGHGCPSAINGPRRRRNSGCNRRALGQMLIVR